MLRRLFRLLIVGALVFLIVRVVSRVLNNEDDFEDYEDTDMSLDFAETPVEIDVPYEPGTAANASSNGSESASLAPEASDTAGSETVAAASEGSGDLSSTTSNAGVTNGTSDTTSTEAPASTGGASVLDVNGIGPTYAGRLKEIGIDTLAALSSANPDDIAEKLNVIGGRNEVEDWIKQANDMTSGQASSGSKGGE